MNPRVSTAGQADAESADRAQAVSRYGRLMGMIATDRCVLLDGATGTELIGVSGQRPEVEEHLWGLTALLDSPDDVLARASPVRRDRVRRDLHQHLGTARRRCAAAASS